MTNEEFLAMLADNRVMRDRINKTTGHFAPRNYWEEREERMTLEERNE